MPNSLSLSLSRSGGVSAIDGVTFTITPPFPTPSPSIGWHCVLSLTHTQIAREAEAAMFHRQLFEELRRSTKLSQDPSEAVAIGAVESSFKCCASAIIILTKTGR